jgi:hypothetical protein
MARGFAGSTSSPTVASPARREKVSASGSPTYPRPTTATRAVRFAMAERKLDAGSGIGRSMRTSLSGRACARSPARALVCKGAAIAPDGSAGA